MELLPLEIKWKFYENLPIGSILQLCQVDKSFNSICNDSSFWRYLLKRDFDITDTRLDPKITYIQNNTANGIADRTIFVLRDEEENEVILTILAEDENELFKLISELYNSGALESYPILYRKVLEFLEVESQNQGVELSEVTPELIKIMYEADDTLNIMELDIDFVR